MSKLSQDDPRYAAYQARAAKRKQTMENKAKAKKAVESVTAIQEYSRESREKYLGQLIRSQTQNAFSESLFDCGMTVADAIRQTAQESKLEGVSHPMFNLHNNWVNSILASMALNAFDARLSAMDIYMSAGVHGLTNKQYGYLETLEYKYAGFAHLANWLVNDYGVDTSQIYRTLDWIETIKTEDDSADKLAARYLQHGVVIEAGSLASEAMIDMQLLEFPNLTREDILAQMAKEKEAATVATTSLAHRQFALLSEAVPEIITELNSDVDWVKSVSNKIRGAKKLAVVTAQGYNDAPGISMNPFDQQILKELEFDWGLVHDSYFSRMVSSARKAVGKTAMNLNNLANGQTPLITQMMEKMSKARVDHVKACAASEITAIRHGSFLDTKRSAGLVNDTYEIKFNCTDAGELKEFTDDLKDARRLYGFTDEAPQEDSHSMFSYPRNEVD